MTPAEAKAVKTGARSARLAPAALIFQIRAVIVLVLLTAAFAIASPAFLTGSNLTILVKHVAINAILAVGMTFVILSGGIDLSVGSIAGLAGMIAGALISKGIVFSSAGVVFYPHASLAIVTAVVAGIVIG